jgi:hypothetical protein
MTGLAEQQPAVTTIRTGESWQDISAGRDIPEQFISRILAFLGSTVEGDIVHTNYSAGGRLDDDPYVVEQMVLVGADGVGRRLRRRRFDVGAEELLCDVDAIYLCEVALDEVRRIRYAFIDVQSGDGSPGVRDVTLVCRRGLFMDVYAHLKMGGSGGAMWRGASVEEQGPILELNEDTYVFDPALLKRLERETVEFLQGDVAAKLREWDVPAKNGIVLYGDPGNGKTVLTRICAKYALEAGMDVVIIEGRRKSRLSFDRGSMGLGDELRRGAARSPVLLVFEDIDLHCQKRADPKDAPSAGRAEQQQPLAELLDFLDGMEPTDGYVLLASTNAMYRLDPALVRPGRIDVVIEVQKPDAEQRVKALQRMIEKGPQPVPDPSRAADLLEGASFAGLAEVARRYKIAAAFGSQGEERHLLEQTAEAFMRERDFIREDGAPVDPAQELQLGR